MSTKNFLKLTMRILGTAVFLGVFVLAATPSAMAQDGGGKFCFCHNIDPGIPDSGTENCTGFSAFDEFKESATAHYQHYLCNVCFDACNDFPTLRGCEDCADVSGDSCSVLDDTGMCNHCGNDIQEPGEECDDGNNEDGDGCSADCKTDCKSDADCDDMILCSVDTCNTQTGQCSHDFSACECTTDADCDDGNVCTQDDCIIADGICDNIPLTNDLCENGKLRNGNGNDLKFEGSGCGSSLSPLASTGAMGNGLQVLWWYLLPALLVTSMYFRRKK